MDSTTNLSDEKTKMDSTAILSDDVTANDSTKVRLTYLQTRKVNISYGFK